MIAASQLAIPQNYTNDLASRELALNQALTLYSQLQQPFELAQALIYAGFYQLQLRNGEKAFTYFNEAKNIAVELGSKYLLTNSDFYIAFAILDQGLDQTALKGHPTDPIKLQQAINLLNNFILSEPAPCFRATALTFLGWAHSDLENYDQALNVLNEAKRIYKEINMETSFGYASYSIMRIHLERENYSAVIAMRSDKITTRLQASFLARAYYETKQFPEAIETLNLFKKQYPNMWQKQDEKRLVDYQNSQKGILSKLLSEPKAHLVYCESDWLP
jgi:tetratricopeptide (TPR) repeat protein